MTEFFSSAFGYLSNLSSQNNGAVLNGVVEIGTVKLRVKKVIAEGGFSTIFAAQALDSGKTYALKRILAADNEANASVIAEIQILKKLSGHPNIVKFLSASYVDKNQSIHGQHEYMILMELCCSGTLLDVLSSSTQNSLSAETVCKLFYQANLAVKHLHQQKPPIIHRDLKLENFLLGEDGRLKLCDFGSATRNAIIPDEKWSAQQHALLQDELTGCTTPMYRTPEMIDTWNNYEIGKAVDVWALGCILYTLCYKKHPFEDSAKLAILNANFSIPQNDLKFRDFHPIIRGCLKINPQERFSVNDILERLASIAETNDYKLNEAFEKWSTIVENPIVPDSETICAASESVGSMNNQFGSVLPPVRSPLPTNLPCPDSRSDQPTRKFLPNNSHSSSISTGSGGLFSQIKGGAESLLKNLKDTSSKMVQSVQSMSRSGVDITYLTSRLAVMSYPGEGLEMTAYNNCAENVRTLLELKHHGTHYSVYNVSRRSYPATRIGKGRLVDCGWTMTRRTPSLHSLYAICQDMYRFLAKNQLNVCVVHCMDGKSSSALLVCAFLMFVHFILKPDDATQLFAVKRTPPSFQPSETRYLKYFSEIVKPSPYSVHFHPMKLISFVMQPVPLFNKSRDGCRPYVEIYQGEERILSTQQEYDKMTLFDLGRGKVTLPLNVTVIGDVTIVMYHARYVLGRLTGIKILQYQFHTGFLSADTTSLECTKNDLDDLSEGEYYQTECFHVTVNLEMSHSIQPYPLLWENHVSNNYSSSVLFSSKLEENEMTDTFGSKNARETDNVSVPVRPAPPRPPPPRSGINCENLMKEHAFSESRPSETDVDLLNLSLNQVDINATGSDHVSINETTITAESKNKEKEILLDLDIPTISMDDIESEQSVGVDPPSESKPSCTINRINDLTTETSDTFDLLGDLNSAFTLQSTKVNADKKCNISFDPFDFQANLTQDTLFTSTGGTPKNPVGMNCNVGNLFSANSTYMQRNVSTPNLSADLFDDLDKFAKTNNLGTSSDMSSQHWPTSRVTPHFSSTPMSPAGSPVKQNVKYPTYEPNYSRSHFDNISKTDSDKTVKSKSGEDIFGDLLGSQGYSFNSTKGCSGPRTINEMRKEEMAKEMDPDKLKVVGWTEGKKGNIRALLCSMHTILWEGANWQCEMHQLISPADVKKAYRKACLAVHPDKQIGTANETLAKLIFVELNNAWSEFEKDANQQNIIFR